MRRDATPRRYLMCPPAHFKVTYSINPWMDPAKPVDLPLAQAQWEDLRDRYRALGHTVETLVPDPALPDMVYAANGALVIDGRVLGARFAYAERSAEAEIHLEWFRTHGFRDIHEPSHINEGEGDFAVTATYILAGRGYRSSPLSHDEAQEFFGRPVIGLDLVDPRFYHLDTALCVLDGDEIMYHPCGLLARQPGRLAAAVPRRPDRGRRGRGGLRPELRLRRPARPAPPGRGGSAHTPARAGLRADPDGSGRAAQGRWQHQVLHAGAAAVTAP